MKCFVITTTVYIFFLIPIKLFLCQDVDFSFPANLSIGAATASYQVEGAWNISDKGENSWDTFTHSNPGSIADGTNGDIACDSYNKYEEDVEWLNKLGVDFYRFSLSWSRILPNGIADKISNDGIRYYKNLTEALLAKNITPVVTIYHWDHPRHLEEMGGWTNGMMVQWYTDYARIVFRELGPLVKSFITMNEPNVLCTHGYDNTLKAPGKSLHHVGKYLCVHNMLKAHAIAYRIYDEEFRPMQNGKIGINTACSGFVSGENTTEASLEQAFQFNCGWVMHPIFIGDYPEIMKTRIAMLSRLEGHPRSRLPEFSKEWIDAIRGTSDFFGFNHYTSSIPVLDPDEEKGIYTSDNGIISFRNESWSKGASVWLNVVPEGFGNLLRMIRDHYDNPPVYIFENGYSDHGESDDYERINYYYLYLKELLKAVKKDGCNIQGYTIWSLLDNFEWEAGYSERFGIIGVDMTTPNRTRIAKLSTTWWQKVMQIRELQPVPLKR